MDKFHVTHIVTFASRVHALFVKIAKVNQLLNVSIALQLKSQIQDHVWIAKVNKDVRFAGN